MRLAFANLSKFHFQFRETYILNELFLQMSY